MEEGQSDFQDAEKGERLRRNLDTKMTRMTVLGCEARKCPNKLAGCFVRLPTLERLPALGLPTRYMLGYEDRN